MESRRTVYTTGQPCASCRAAGRETTLLRLRAFPKQPPRGMMPRQVASHYNITFCVDCDGDLGVNARSFPRRSS